QRKLARADEMLRFRLERRMNGHEIGLGQESIERDVREIERPLFALRDPSRSPIEQTHGEAAGTLRDRAPDAPTAADESYSLAPDKRAFEAHGLRAREHASAQQAIAFHDTPGHGEQQPEMQIRGSLGHDGWNDSHGDAPRRRRSNA